MAKVQMEHFGLAQSEALRSRLQGYLESSFVGLEARTGMDTRAFVERGLARARHYDITGESEVARYLGLMLVWGIDFDERTTDPSLHDPSIPARTRLDELVRHALAFAR